MKRNSLVLLLLLLSFFSAVAFAEDRMLQGEATRIAPMEGECEGYYAIEMRVWCDERVVSDWAQELENLACERTTGENATYVWISCSRSVCHGLMEGDVVKINYETTDGVQGECEKGRGVLKRMVLYSRNEEGTTTDMSSTGKKELPDEWMLILFVILGLGLLVVLIVLVMIVYLWRKRRLPWKKRI